MILSDKKQLQGIKEFCESMGLSQEQIDCILASDYTPGYDVELFDTKKVRSTIVLSADRSTLNSMSRKQILKKFLTKQKIKRDLNPQNLTLDEFMAIKSYTRSGDEDINYYGRYGVKAYRNNMMSCLFSKNNELEKRVLDNLVLFEIAHRAKCENKEISKDEEKLITEKIEKLLQTNPKGELWTRQEIANVFKDCEGKLNKKIVDATISVVGDFVDEVAVAIKDYDTIKQTIGYKNDGLNKPTILHRINNMNGLAPVFGVKLQQGEALTEKDVVGKNIDNHSFTSTSALTCDELKKFINCHGNRVDMEILVPQGTKGVMISSISHFSDEQEILLNPNSIYIYDAQEAQDGVDLSGKETKVLKVYGIAISKDITSYPTKMSSINMPQKEDEIKTHNTKEQDEMALV